MNNFDNESKKAFNELKEKYSLDEKQVDQFKQYALSLDAVRTQFNITAIESIQDMVAIHFEDSLSLSGCYDLSSITTIADVGTGGGFPGIPLKIIFPHLHVILIEVSTKKCEFLKEIALKLQLENIEIVQLDWRTFLRKTRYPIELFVARASLHTDELMRMFQPSSAYKHALLVYWASRHWQMADSEHKFFFKECDYTIHTKKRKLIFFKVP